VIARSIAREYYVTPHIVPVLHTMDLVAPALAALVFICVMGLVSEPARQRFNAILVAGAGAAYLNGGLGPWEIAYVVAATLVAYKGLSSYRYIAVAWWMHACWDVVHHLYATPIWPWSPTSSAGCGIFDSLIAVWFFMGAPAWLARRPGHLGRARRDGVSACGSELIDASDQDNRFYRRPAHE